MTAPPWAPVLVVLSVMVALAPRRRPPSRLVGFVSAASAPTAAAPPRRAAGAVRPHRAPVGDRLARAVGGGAGGVVGLDLDDAVSLRLGRAMLVAGAGAALHWLLAVPVGALTWAAPAWRERGRQRRRAAAVVAETPDLVELFRLAVGAGLTVHLAVEAVATRAGGVTGAALAAVPDRVAVGERLAEALAPVAACGDGVRPLVDALVASERYGVALGPSLERVALEARLIRRRRAEEAARRLPVLLVFPLVVCILPAFVLLSIVPLLVGSLSRLTG